MKVQHKIRDHVPQSMIDEKSDGVYMVMGLEFLQRLTLLVFLRGNWSFQVCDVKYVIRGVRLVFSPSYKLARETATSQQHQKILQ